MVDVIDYENIENISAEQYWQDAASANSTVPWINWPMIDAESSVENIPEYEPEDIDITPDLTWWTTDIVWTADTHNKISRSAWSIFLAWGITYSVNAWSKSNITAITYIYYNWTPTLATTTQAEQSVWTNKILLCVAKNVPSPNKLQFQAFGTAWLGVFITADNIAANTITANQIAANTISASQIRSDYVYAWNINANQITAWKMSADMISWWTITGITITGSTIQTATSWQRIVMNTNNTITFYNSFWGDCWSIYWWTFSNASWTFNALLLTGNTRIAWHFVPSSDRLYDLWSTWTNRRRDIYMSRELRFEREIFLASGNRAVTTATTASNRYINVYIRDTNWTPVLYKLLLAT